jgi:hypothetical protein
MLESPDVPSVLLVVLIVIIAKMQADKPAEALIEGVELPHGGDHRGRGFGHSY